MGDNQPNIRHYDGGIWTTIETSEDAERIAERLRASAQERIDNTDSARNERTKRTIKEVLDAYDPTLPPPPGPDLDPDALQAFRRHLTEANVRETCPLCDVDRWVARWERGRRGIIVKVCLRCGFIASFDAVVVGISEPGPPHLVVIDGQLRLIRPGR